jgi:hypothetical protein
MRMGTVRVIGAEIAMRAISIRIAKTDTLTSHLQVKDWRTIINEKVYLELCTC